MSDATVTGHVDTFCADRLPPPELWPVRRFDGVPELDYPARLNCAAELLDRMVEGGRGDRPAIRWPGGEWSYRELMQTSNRIAHVLVDDLGVVPGNRVLLRAPNTPMLAACWFAVLKAGGVVVCTMALLREREIQYVADTAEILVALTDARVAEDCERAFAHRRDGRVREGARVVRWGDGGPLSLETLMATKPTTFVACDTSAEDTALIAFTSGTTGQGKGTMHAHRDVLAITDCFPRYVLKPDERDVFCGSPPLAFTFALGGLLLFPLRFGACALLLEQATPPHLAKAIAEHRPTVCFTAPTAYRAMHALLGEHDVSSLRKCVSAGETLPAAVFEMWERATGIRIIDGIGATEMLHIFISASGDDIRPGSTGRVVPGYEARVIGDDGRELPPGEVGRLAVRGPTGCRYLDSIERQREYVEDGWNLTGDSYRMDADGYFWYQARTDDIIVSSGYNIAGPEVENVLLEHAGVQECAVVAAPDVERGQIVKAFVVLRAGHEAGPARVKELQDWVKARIAPYKYPRAVEFVTELPRTTTGKLQRYRLRAAGEMGASPDAAPPARAPDESSAASPAERRVLRPGGWKEPSGYENGVVATGRLVVLAGQIGWDPTTCAFATDDFAAQTEQALRNVVALLAEAGAEPRHLVRLTWYVTSRDEYVAARHAIGHAYRNVVGRHYPPMSVVIVAGLVERRALVEIEATAVVPYD